MRPFPSQYAERLIEDAGADGRFSRRFRRVSRSRRSASPSLNGRTDACIDCPAARVAGRLISRIRHSLYNRMRGSPARRGCNSARHASWRSDAATAQHASCHAGEASQYFSAYGGLIIFRTVNMTASAYSRAEQPLISWLMSPDKSGARRTTGSRSAAQQAAQTPVLFISIGARMYATHTISASILRGCCRLVPPQMPLLPDDASLYLGSGLVTQRITHLLYQFIVERIFCRIPVMSDWHFSRCRATVATSRYRADFAFMRYFLLSFGKSSSRQPCALAQFRQADEIFAFMLLHF